MALRVAAVLAALLVCGRASARAQDGEAIALRSHSGDATEHYAVGLSLLGTGLAAIALGVALPQPHPWEIDRGREIGPAVAGIGACVLALGIGLDVGAALWSTARRSRTGAADLALEMRELSAVRTGLGIASLVIGGGGALVFAITLADPPNDFVTWASLLAGSAVAMGVGTILGFVSIGLQITAGQWRGNAPTLAIAPTTTGGVLVTRGSF